MEVKKRPGHYIKFVVYLIAVVLINAAGMSFFFRWDLTENRIYSISRASQQAVQTLSEPLTINVFFTKNLPAPHNNTERFLHDLLEEYAVHANRYFNYRFYDVSPDEGDISEKAKENQKLARNYGIYPIQIQLIEKDEVKFQKAYMGLVLIHGDIIERIPTIADTDGLEYKLTMAIQKMNNKISRLLSLTDKIQAKLFLSSSLESVAPYMGLTQLKDIPDSVASIIQKLNSKNYNKLEFQHLDPTTDATLEKSTKAHRLMNLKWPALSEGKIPPGKGSIGLVLQHGEKSVTVPLLHVMRIPIIGTRYELANMNDLEQTIDKNIEALIEINDNIGYITNRGTPQISAQPPQAANTVPPPETLSRFRSLLSQSYTIKPINLAEEDIPNALNCLVIAGPKETFTDYELFKIDQFLMKGKSLALFVDAYREVMPPGQRGSTFSPNQMPTYIPIQSGIEKLLAHYGIRVKKSYVLDENCYKQTLPAQFGGGEQPVYFAPIIKSMHIDSSQTIMQNIKGLIALKISPLGLEADRIKTHGINAYRLFSSSEKSWEMSERITLNPMFIRPPQTDEEQQSYPLAYVLEGEFPSFFAGKPIPEKKSEPSESKKTDEETDKNENAQDNDEKKPDIDLSKIEREGDVLKKGKPGKIFIMASSELLKDNLLETQGRSPNSMFIMNMVDYLNHREDIAVMRSKEQRFNPLMDTAASTKAFVKSFNIAGLPVLVALFGLAIWFRRHSRKKQIRMMFQK